MGIYHKHALDDAPFPLHPLFTQPLSSNTEHRAPKPQLKTQRCSIPAVPTLLPTGERAASMMGHQLYVFIGYWGGKCKAVLAREERNCDCKNYMRRDVVHLTQTVACDYGNHSNSRCVYVSYVCLNLPACVYNIGVIRLTDNW